MQISKGVYEECIICPRECRADRTVGPVGFCRSSDIPSIAHFGPHHWEEPPISGWLGSGTVFFSGCNLRCSYCQNVEISREEIGLRVNPKQLADIFLKLGSECHNINLVTAAHQLPSVVDALSIAKQKGLAVPVVYNTSSYEKASAIKQLKGLVDIYLPDFKYVSPSLSEELSAAPDYFDVASEAILEMQSQVGHLEMDESGMAKRGVLVRHLVLPGQIDDSKMVLGWVRENLGKYAHISIMSQYTPEFLQQGHAPFTRRVNQDEYDEVLNEALRLGLCNAFIQELSSANTSYVPLFNQIGKHSPR